MYCPQTESALHAQDELYDDTELSIVEWHVSWPGSDYMYYHNVVHNNGRRNFYGVNAVPAVKVDGNYTSLNSIPTAMNQATDISLEIGGFYDTGLRTGDWTVDVTAEAALPAGTYQVYVVLTEDPTYQGSIYYDTARQAYPSHVGTNVTFTGPYPQTVQVSGTFALDYTNQSGPYAGQWVNYVEENCRLVAWLQNTESIKKVQQSANVFVSTLADLTDVPANAPAFMSMGKNYPNPFNPTTVIPVKVDASSSAVLRIVGVDGRIVTTLHEGELATGDYEFTWNGTDAQGNGVATGVYMAQFITRAGVQSERLVMLK